MHLSHSDSLIDADKHPNRLGAAIEAAEQQTRQFSRTWDQVSTADPYTEIALSGRVIHVNMATSPGALFAFHVDQIGRPVYLSRGYTKVCKRPFRRLYVQRPTTPLAVPADANRLLVVDVGENPDDVRPGSDDPYAGSGLGSSNPSSSRLSATAAAVKVFSADPSVRGLRVKNLDPAEVLCYGFANTLTNANGFEVYAGDVQEIPVNCDLYVIRKAAANVPFQLEVFK
jgi:hypothetical protein